MVPLKIMCLMLRHAYVRTKVISGNQVHTWFKNQRNKLIGEHNLKPLLAAHKRSID